MNTFLIYLLIMGDNTVKFLIRFDSISSLKTKTTLIIYILIPGLSRLLERRKNMKWNKD